MPAKPMNLFMRQEVLLKEKMQTASRELWDAGMIDAVVFQEAMKPYLNQLVLTRRFLYAVALPVNVFQLIRRKLRTHEHG